MIHNPHDFSFNDNTTLLSRVCGIFTYFFLTIFNANPLKDTTTMVVTPMQTHGINIIDEIYLGTIRMAFGIATAVVIYYLTKKKSKNG